MIISALLLIGQKAICQDSLKVQSTSAVVSTEIDQTFYTNFENHIYLNVAGEKDLFISSNIGKLSKDPFGNLIIFFNYNDTGSCHLKLYNSKRELKGYFFYQVKHLPLPIPTIGWQTTGDKMKKSVLLQSVLVTTKNDGLGIDIFPRIKSYKAIIIYQNSVAKAFSNVGNKLTDELKSAISSMHSDDVILFYDIVAENSVPNKEDMNLETLKLTIE
jgi:hypothetical protein